MSDFLLPIAVGVLLALLAAGVYAHNRGVRGRAQFIRSYVFPESVIAKFRQKHPELDRTQVRMVERALRSFFLLWLRSRHRRLGMPSNAVDDLWHEFILDTRAYSAFCKRAFGRFFHHVPASPGASEERAEELARTWRLGCLAEKLDPRKSATLPLLFAVDTVLAIRGGQVYRVDAMTELARSRGKDSGCAGGGCGSGCASGCGSGCGGGGCGGGGCGGSD